MKKALLKSSLALLVAAITALAVCGPRARQHQAHADEPAISTDASVARAQKTVRMLDDLYKTTIVLITKNYVDDEASTPAAATVGPLWETMEKNGWHKVRLVDATGDPYDTDNVAKTNFEKKAIKQLTAKTTYLDRVVTEKGKRYLEAMTYIPMVMEKCTLCHPNYSDLPEGAAVGAVSYRIPIDD